MRKLTANRDSTMFVSDYEKGSLWDKSDYNDMSLIIKKIQRGNKCDKILNLRYLENILDRYYNDHKNLQFQPIGVCFAKNIVTIDGLVMLTELMAGSAFDVPLFLASGTGTAETDENQETLANENARNSVIDEGWRLSDGNSVKMGSRFDPNTASASITEFGSFDQMTGGNMEWRVLLDTPLVHTQGSTFYMSYHSLNLIPR